MFQNILVPTDGSEHAHKAVEIASDLAEKYGANLILLHVVLRDDISEAMRHMAEVEHIGDSPSGGVSGLLASVPEGRFPASIRSGDEPLPWELLEYLGKRVLTSAEEVARAKGVKSVATAVEDGDPVKRILERAESTGADLIVMGSRGMSDLKGLLVGSVSHKVSHLAKCSCIAVR